MGGFCFLWSFVVFETEVSLLEFAFRLRCADVAFDDAFPEDADATDDFEWLDSRYERLLIVLIASALDAFESDMSD